MDNKIILTPEERVNLILSKNKNITPFGVSLNSEDYENIVKGYEKEISSANNSNSLLNDYITVLRYVKNFEFIHYSNIELTELCISLARDLTSFGKGIYCYDAKKHTIFKDTSLLAHKGIYTGYILECVYDCDPQEDKYKDYGNTKEYCLLPTENSIAVKYIGNKN